MRTITGTRIFIPGQKHVTFTVGEESIKEILEDVDNSCVIVVRDNGSQIEYVNMPYILEVNTA